MRASDEEHGFLLAIVGCVYCQPRFLDFARNDKKGPAANRVLFDDDTEKAFLAGAEQEFARLIQLNFFAEIAHALFVDFDSSLLDQAFRFTPGWSEIEFDQ